MLAFLEMLKHNILLYLMMACSKVSFSPPLLLLLLAEKSSDDSFHHSLFKLFSTSPQSFISLLLLGVTVVLSGSIYLWVLRYVCIGCCQPISISPESEILPGMV